MKSYFIDELKKEEIEKIKSNLKKKGFLNPLKDIFWIEIPEKLLSPVQKEHLSTCGPYVFSLETGKDWIKLELLVRATGKIRCLCVDFATRQQRDFIMEIIDEIYSAATSK